MSFILDALRKSEARRKKGEVPGLDSGPGPAEVRSRRRFPAWILLAVPLCLVMVGAGVFLLRPEWMPQGLVDGSAPDPSPAPEATVVPEPVDDESLDPPADERRIAQVEPIEEVSTEVAGDTAADDEEAATDEQEQAAAVDRRRAVQPATGQTVTRAAPERERVVTDQDEAMAEIERRVAETRRRQEEADADRRARERPVADREREQRRRTEASPEVTGEPSETAVQPEWRTQTAEYVRAWELPLSVRRDLPELRLSIHVFSAEEGGRFVLINGERYVPGDRLSGGARLVDIRREGAIVDFREHRFLLEP